MMASWMIILLLAGQVEPAPREPSSGAELCFASHLTPSLLTASAERLPATDQESFGPQQLGVHEQRVLEEDWLSHDEGPHWGWNASVLGGGGIDSLAMVDLRLTRAWRQPRLLSESGVRWSPGLGMHFWTGLEDAQLPSTLFDLFVDLSLDVWQYERGAVTCGVTPGLYGDFQTLHGNLFQVTGWLNATYEFTDRLTLVGGVAVVRQLDSNWLPMGGLIWRPSPEWQLDLVFPRPRIARQIRQTEDGDAWCYVTAQFGGGAWAIEDPLVGPALVRYSDVRLLAGMNVWRVSGRELSMEAGYVFSRQVTIDDVDVATPSDTWVLQLSWAF